LAAGGRARAEAAAGSKSTANPTQLRTIRRIGGEGYPATEERPAFSRSCVAVADDRLQRRADGLAARVEALAQALRAGGVSEEASAQLLSNASAAVLQALRLELLIEQPKPAAAPRRSVVPVIRLAA
jgi:hypothetical protein